MIQETFKSLLSMAILKLPHSIFYSSSLLGHFSQHYQYMDDIMLTRNSLHEFQHIKHVLDSRVGAFSLQQGYFSLPKEVFSCFDPRFKTLRLQTRFHPYKLCSPLTLRQWPTLSRHPSVLQTCRMPPLPYHHQTRYFFCN